MHNPASCSPCILSILNPGLQSNKANPGSQKTYCGPSFIQKRALATLGREIKGVEAQENQGVGGVQEGEREIGDLKGQDAKETGGGGIISKHFVIEKREEAKKRGGAENVRYRRQQPEYQAFLWPSPLSLFRFHLSPFPQKRVILRLRRQQAGTP